MTLQGILVYHYCQLCLIEKLKADDIFKISYTHTQVAHIITLTLSQQGHKILMSC